MSDSSMNTLTLHKLFRFTDQKDVPLMLSPTHEEEITKLVGDMLNSYKTLPLRLYQISIMLKPDPTFDG